MTGDTARVDRMVRMANQISVSVPDARLAADETAAHLRAFWAPVMIDDLADVARREPERLQPAVRAALALLRPVETAHG
jgi:hypothetical protein